MHKVEINAVYIIMYLYLLVVNTFSIAYCGLLVPSHALHVHVQYDPSGMMGWGKGISVSQLIFGLTSKYPASHR